MSLQKKMKFSIKDFFSKCDQIRRKHFLCSGNFLSITFWLKYSLDIIWLDINFDIIPTKLKGITEKITYKSKRNHF